MQHAFLQLANNQQLTSSNQPLCFLAFPIDGFGTGIEQAAWLYLIAPNNPVYYDPSTILTQADSNILENTGWRMRCSNYYDKNYFTIAHTATSIRLTSLNPEKINFTLPQDYLSLGKKNIHSTYLLDGKNVVTDFTLTFAQKYLEQKPLIIVWDYEKQQFVVLT